MPPVIVETARRRFREVFGTDPAAVAVAPGRVNLIGEHTDYNDGFVLPMALDRYVIVAFRGTGGPALRAHAVQYEETREVAVEALGRAVEPQWFRYVVGVAWGMREAGYAVAGADLLVTGDVPIGAGLASSAALELAVARALARNVTAAYARHRDGGALFVARPVRGARLV